MVLGKIILILLNVVTIRHVTWNYVLLMLFLDDYKININFESFEESGEHCQSPDLLGLLIFQIKLGVFYYHFILIKISKHFTIKV